MARVPLVRATGHGIASIRDASGRVVARRGPHEGPGALIAHVPLA